MQRAFILIAAGALGFVVWQLSQTASARQMPIITNTKTGGMPRMFNPTALLNLIARAEANNGYNSYYVGSRVRPSKPVSQMTLSEARAFQTAMQQSGSVSTAIGRYQFIGTTLQSLINRLRVAPSAIFNAGVQDNFALTLINDAGLERYRAGTLSAADFARALSRVWAGLPGGPNGVSYYQGVAGNRAQVSWADLLAAIGG